MKLILICLSIISASLVASAAASPGAFDKLRQSFDSAGGAVRVADIHLWTTKIKGCATSSKTSPNEITSASFPVSVSYTSPGFGPDFPSQTLKGIGLDDKNKQMREVSEAFFQTYREVVAPNEIQLATTRWYPDSDCSTDSDGNYDCWDFTNSENVNLILRLNSKFLYYKKGDAYAYCWQ